MEKTFDIVLKWKNYYQYLEMLRLSGITNMYGAAPLLSTVMDIDLEEANTVLLNWMHNYDQLSKMYGWKKDKKWRKF